MRITESTLRRIVREEIVGQAVREGRMTLREGRRLVEQGGPPNLADLTKTAESMKVVDGLTKGDANQFHMKGNEMVAKGLFDKDSDDMRRFQDEVADIAKQAVNSMYDRYFGMDDDKVIKAGKEGYQKYAYSYKMDASREFPCKDGKLTDVQAYAVPYEKGIATKAYAVLNRDGKRTNIQITGLPRKEL